MKEGILPAYSHNWLYNVGDHVGTTGGPSFQLKSHCKVPVSFSESVYSFDLVFLFLK